MGSGAREGEFLVDIRKASYYCLRTNLLPRSMMKPPTEAELRILKVLWGRGASTAREVQAELPPPEVGYTTVLKLLQIMEKKRLVNVDRGERAHTYAARHDREATLGGLARDFVERIFDGATEEMVLHLVPKTSLDTKEIANLRQRLAALRKTSGGRHDS